MVRARRNRTLTLNSRDIHDYSRSLVRLRAPARVPRVLNRTICQDVSEALDRLPGRFVDLLFADPPYNLDKTFSSRGFRARTLEDYASWAESWISRLPRILKPTAAVYLCGDWRSSAALHQIARKYFTVRNRITWEREKGRGARKNWKNVSEDIWFCTMSDDYTFHAEAVKLKRHVIAPYRTNGAPKDWEETPGGGYRLTHPSNLWTDLTVPFWSMPENTDHPTQKPEKLLAKIILASSDPGDVVLDPFLGSGTTSVTAKKLGRRYVGIEIDRRYACLAEKRLALAERDKTIQGYADGVFWERNTTPLMKRTLPNR